MAKNDVRIREYADGFVKTVPVQDRTTSGATATIKPGEPVKLASDGSQYVILLATGDPEQGTDVMVGVATSESTETSAADGKVEILVPGPNTVLEAKATTVANVDTQAKIDALINNVVSMDLTAGVFTIDENEAHDDNVHGFVITGGDFRSGDLYVTTKDAVLQAGSAL